MHPKTIQDILPWVEQPSSYLGTEVNTIRKPHDGVKLKFLLAFPDLYEIGTSHFGMQILYHLINREKDLLAERVFAPSPDAEEILRREGISLSSLESKTDISRFDIIGFSLLYELNYTNVLNMLSLGNIPFRASERGEEMPFIIAGGPCTSNPEPMAEFFDAMVIGDGEGVVPALAAAWIAWKEQGASSKDQLLEAWAGIEGVYIPKFYEPVYEADGSSFVRKKASAPAIVPDRVRRAIIPELKGEDFPDHPIVPFGKPIHDRLRLEIARGCSRGCRFCQAGIIYRPVRERSVDQLRNLMDASLAATGYEDLSLLSLSTGDYSHLVPLMETVMGRCEKEHIAVSLPSVRAGTISPALMTLIKKVRKTGFTMAVEAGSQRLRDAVNKNITQEDIFTAVADAFRLGWQVIKLYFMIGLPGETREDLEEMAALVKAIEQIKGPDGRRGKINVSVNTFIPKSHTPFQWAGQLSLADAKEKIFWLKEAVRSPRVQFKWHTPETSFIEGIWARGDRRLADLLIDAYGRGCRFDGWSNHFSYEKWREAIRETAISPEEIVCRDRALSEPLPWDHIDSRVEKGYFAAEWEKAKAAVKTPDCVTQACSGCGVCDFKKIRPLYSLPPAAAPVTGTPRGKGEDIHKTVSVYYEKVENARFFGHLELVNIFLRGFRRAGISIPYSQGFHPLPKISFDDPLPSGFESLEESFRIQVPASLRPDMIQGKLNETLPQGLRITRCENGLSRSGEPSDRRETFEIRLRGETFDTQCLGAFDAAENMILTHTNKKGKTREMDLKEVVSRIQLPEPGTLTLVLHLSPGKTVRPGHILKGVFHLPEEVIQGARILKLRTEWIS